MSLLITLPVPKFCLAKLSVNTGWIVLTFGPMITIYIKLCENYPNLRMLTQIVSPEPPKFCPDKFLVTAGLIFPIYFEYDKYGYEILKEDLKFKIMDTFADMEACPSLTHSLKL